MGSLISILGFTVIPACRSVFAAPHIDKQLRPYVNQFLKYCHQYERDCSSIADFKIEFDSLADVKVFFPGVVGICTPADKTILINTEYFNEEGFARREQLVFHELGHCILKLDHTDPDTIQIMHPSTLPGNVYLQLYPILMNDFFGCKTNCPIVKFDRTRYTK